MRGIAAVALVLGLWGCSGSGEETCTGVAPAKLSDVQAAIFTPSCATSGCHTGSLPAESLSLDADKSFAQLVNRHAASDPSRVLVTPGNLSASYLFDQVNSGVMPQNASKLSQAQLDQIKGWICAGAPND